MICHKIVTNKCLLLLLLIVTYSSIGCNRTSDNNITSVKTGKLQLVTTFPKYSDLVYFDMPVDIEIGEEYVYISDQLASTVYVFDLKDNFVRKIGQPGRGPEDFSLQIGIEYYHNKILFIKNLIIA